MLVGFTVLLVCQLFGEVVARSANLPLPGPVVGLVALVIGLHLAARRHGDRTDSLPVTRVADGLLANLSLLFVPAGVGIIDQLGVLRTEAVAITASLLVSTTLALLVTVLTFLAVKRWLGRGSAA